MSEVEFLKPLTKHNVSCPCCGGNGAKLSLETVLYNGFGGWHITKNGEGYYEADMNSDNPKTMAHIENQAEADPDNDWRAICFTPLHGETYQRQNGEWVLVEQNEGFA